MSDLLSDEELDAIAARVEAATPGPWKSHANLKCKCGIVTSSDYPVCTVTIGNWGDDYPTLKMTGGSLDRKVEAVMDQITYGHVTSEQGNANGVFIANARVDVTRLLATIRALKAAGSGPS